MTRAIPLAAVLVLPFVGTACGNSKDDASSGDSFAPCDAISLRRAI